MFVVFTAIQIVIAVGQVASITSFTDWSTFFLYHNVATVHFFDWILYGCAAIVQLIKIFNFVSHKTGHSKYEKENERHKCMSFIGLVLSSVSFVLLIANMYLLTYYQQIGGQVLIAYNAVQTVVMIPLLHAMIVNQESQGQRSAVNRFGGAEVMTSIN